MAGAGGQARLDPAPPSNIPLTPNTRHLSPIPYPLTPGTQSPGTFRRRGMLLGKTMLSA